MLLVLLALATTISTFLGGVVAFRNQHKMHALLGFTAGVLLGVVAFEVFPEIFMLIQAHHMPPMAPMLAFVVGFLAFHIVEKLTIIHYMHEDEYATHNHPLVGVLSALALIGHSVADGIGIGLGFQVSTEVGVLVAIAVIAHDFSDGLNTVSLVLTHNNTAGRARLLLACDALAPVCGAASTLLFTLPESFLVLYLGVFAGFLMYIGASDILPQAHSQHSSVSTIMLTLLGLFAQNPKYVVHNIFGAGGKKPEFMRNELLDLTTIVPATAYHRRSYAARHSRSTPPGPKSVIACSSA